MSAAAGRLAQRLADVEGVAGRPGEQQRPLAHADRQQRGVGALQLQQLVRQGGDVRQVARPVERRRRDRPAGHGLELRLGQHPRPERLVLLAPGAAREASHQVQRAAAPQQPGGRVVVFGRGQVVGEAAGVLVQSEQRQAGELRREGVVAALQLAHEERHGRADRREDAAAGRERVFGGGGGVVVVHDHRHRTRQVRERSEPARVGRVDDHELLDTPLGRLARVERVQPVAEQAQAGAHLLRQRIGHRDARARMQPPGQRQAGQGVEIRLLVGHDQAHGSTLPRGRYGCSTGWASGSRSANAASSRTVASTSAGSTISFDECM